jgi:hypothetical protein
MAVKKIIRTHEDHVMHRVSLLRFYRKERGTFRNKTGNRVPKTTNRDVAQLTKWWDEEFKRSRANAGWYKTTNKTIWKEARIKIANDLKRAEPDAEYKDNDWFWYHAMIKLAILLSVAKSRPSPTELFVEALKETVDERIEDADRIIDGASDAVNKAASAAGKAVETVTEAGERAWSGLKIAGIVGAGLLGAAFVLPPIIRAFRD